MKLNMIVAGLVVIAATAPVHADESVTVAAANLTPVVAEARPRIVVPALKVGGLPQGQVMVINDSGAKVMSSARAAEDALKLSLNKADFCAVR